MTQSRIKDRIRKLLNLAGDDAATDAEVESAMRHARRLMLEHSLTEDEVRTVNEGKTLSPDDIAAATEYAARCVFGEGSRFSFWEDELAGTLCMLMGSVSVYKDPRGGTTTLHFYGPAVETAEAAAMFDEWRETIAALARLKYGGALRGPGRSYAIGFVRALWDKVQTILTNETTKLGTGCTALMLTNQLAVAEARKRHAKTWLAKAEGVKTQRGRSKRSTYDPAAYNAGAADGVRAKFGRNTQKRLG